MADNLAVTPGTGATMAADDIGGVLYPRAKIAYGADGSASDVTDTLCFPVRLAPRIVAAASTLTRPADTTAYANGDLVANSTTAASVTAFSFTAARGNDIPGTIRSCRLLKSTTGTTQPFFRVHIYNSNPVASAPAGGDNAAFNPANKAGWLGALDVSTTTPHGDGYAGIGSPTYNTGIIFTPASGSQTLYALLEARGAYAPGNAEVFTLELHIE